MPVERVVAPGHDRNRSLGWLASAWMDHFCVHGPGDIQGQRVRLSDELAALTADVYALDERGRRLYDSCFYSRPKGCDKSGHGARIALFEGLGPSRFAGWAEGGEVYQWMDFRYVYDCGEPLGRPVVAPFLRILATEEGQAGNVYDTVYLNLREGPLREAFARPDDVGLTRVYLPGGGEIRPSTASSSAKDGGKETWCNFDETHLYITPELRRMYATVRRNMAKRKAAEPWSFETSTMYQPGQESIAEASHKLAKNIRDHKVRLARMLFDHREAPADTVLADEASLRRGLIEAYGSASEYIPIDRIISEIWDPRNDVSDSRRYFLNQVIAAEGAWISPHQWDACADAEKEVEPGELITLGFDGSKTNDHTALVGCRVSDSHLFTIGVWDPELSPGKEVPTVEVDLAVAEAFKTYDVVGFYADVREWESYTDKWELEYGEGLCLAAAMNHPVKWDMRGRTLEATKASESFHSAIIEHDLSHPGHGRDSQYVYNARRWPNRYGVTFGKETPQSERKVDWLAAAVLARKARQDYLVLPEAKKRQQSQEVGVFFA